MGSRQVTCCRSDHDLQVCPRLTVSRSWTCFRALLSDSGSSCLRPRLWTRPEAAVGGVAAPCIKPFFAVETVSHGSGVWSGQDTCWAFSGDRGGHCTSNQRWSDFLQPNPSPSCFYGQLSSSLAPVCAQSVERRSGECCASGCSVKHTSRETDSKIYLVRCHF